MPADDVERLQVLLRELPAHNRVQESRLIYIGMQNIYLTLKQKSLKIIADTKSKYLNLRQTRGGAL
jgi:hypothetical protein